MVKLVPYWKKWHKFLSIRLCAIAAAVKGAWVYIPDDITKFIPNTGKEVIAWSVFALIAVATLIDQDAVKGGTDEPK